MGARNATQKLVVHADLGDVPMASEVRFAVVRKMLEDDGWALGRINGSHHIFKKPGRLDLSIPVHQGKVKPAYVAKARKAISRDSD